MSSNSPEVPIGISKDCLDEEDNLDFMCIPGLGEAANQPKPRVKGTSFFGYVPDAFSEKTPTLPSERTASNTQPPPVNKEIQEFVQNISSSVQAVAFENEQETATSTTGVESAPEVTQDEEDEGASASKPVPSVLKLPIHLQSAQNRLFIRNGKVINADGIQDVDVYIEEGIIKQVGNNLTVPGGSRQIDARGKLVFPGGIDTNTHLNQTANGTTSVDDFYTGTRAAIAGGTTTIINLCVPGKGQSLVEAHSEWRKRAEEKAACNYAFHVAVTSWSPEVQAEMEELCCNFGVNSFKMSMAHKDLWQLNDTALFEAFETCKNLGAIAQVHAENGDIIKENCRKLLALGVTGPEGHEMARPEEVEAEAVNRACVLANQVNCPLYIPHVMSKSAARIIAEKRRQGMVVYGEPIAASLFTDGTHYWHSSWRHAAAHVTEPPLRPDLTTPDFLLELLANDDLQLAGSNHCTFSSLQKKLGENDFTKIPSGVNGIEERMPLLWEKGVVSGKMDLTRFVVVTSTNAAKIFNIYPQKGCIAVGSDADIVIWDPKYEHTVSATTHHSAADFNIFEGMSCRGGPEYVIVNGRVTLDEGNIKAVQGYGRFIPTPAFSDTVYDLVREREHSKVLVKSERGGRVIALRSTIPSEEHKKRTKIVNQDVEVPISEVERPMTNAVSHRVEHFARPPTSSGGRNMQDTTFSLSAEYPNPADESANKRSSVRVKAPPGGHSTGLW